MDANQETLRITVFRLILHCGTEHAARAATHGDVRLSSTESGRNLTESASSLRRCFMKRFALLLTLVLTITAVAVVAADKEKKKSTDKPKEPEATQKEAESDRWMHVKLDAAQHIFADLTHGDLEGVKKQAQKMLVVNILENWLKSNEFTKKSAYQGQLNAFEFANKELIRQAEDDNLDGALDAWVKLSRSCVECHKLIRDPSK